MSSTTRLCQGPSQLASRLSRQRDCHNVVISPVICARWRLARTQRPDAAAAQAAASLTSTGRNDGRRQAGPSGTIRTHGRHEAAAGLFRYTRQAKEARSRQAARRGQIHRSRARNQHAASWAAPSPPLSAARRKGHERKIRNAEICLALFSLHHGFMVRTDDATG